MKILLVNGSSHTDGTTMQALKEMTKVFSEENAESEIIQIGGGPVADCLQCHQCLKLGKCVIDGDGVNEFVEKAESADGFVFATPVYFAHPSGRLLSFLDRAFYSNCGELSYKAFRFKPAAAVTVARRAGTTATLDAVNKYFGIASMPVVSSTYWNMVFDRKAGDARSDEEGMQTMRNLAREMVWMIKCIDAGKKAGIDHPEPEETAVTNFIR